MRLNRLMIDPESCSETLQLHGYCPMASTEILKFVNGGGDLSQVPGDFVLYDSSVTAGFAVTSFLSAIPFYYAISKSDELFIGDNVFEVAKRAKLSWTWNERSIRCLALYGHTLNEDTLCEGVHRLPASSRLSRQKGEWVVEPISSSPFLWDRNARQEEAILDLTDALDQCVGNASMVHLSLSSGYDSRLLLALCLNRGIVPSISVMGNRDSTDVVIASDICRRIDLPIQVIRLDASDYLRLGSSIAYATSGVKTSINWHTYLYCMGKDFSDGIHLVGSNGEFARSFFFDKPRLDIFSKNSPSWMMNAV